MGLVKHLLFWPVTGPKALVDFSMRQIEGVVREELTDDEKVKQDLMALHMELELGDIDEEEYERREAALMERLRDIRRWRVELGMEEEWSPLGFSEADRSTDADAGRSADDSDRQPGDSDDAAEAAPEDGEWSPGS